MSQSVEVVGEGEVEIAAYGVADAEHLVEKEIAALWPGVHVRITAVRHGEGPARIVDEFVIAYRIDAIVDVEDVAHDKAARVAFRKARNHFDGSRYRHVRFRTRSAEAP